MASKRTLDHSSCFPAPKNRNISSCFASSSSSTQPRWTYDVFLSFSGKDTRKTFTGHLYEALNQAGIHTFRDDDELQRGREISSELLKSIEGSRISIVVFSRNYASSRWCLDELVKIIECKKTLGQLVLPIFYDVDPSDVRHQTGCFGEAFGRHEDCYVDEMEKVEVRRAALFEATPSKAALSEAGNIAGWDLKNVANRCEAKFIQKVVEYVSCKLERTFLNVAKHPVGIESRVEHINSLLSIGSDDVHMIGIYGLGGIGKTTLAKAVYNLILHKFDGSCFLANVAGNLNGLVQLQKLLLSELLGTKNLSFCSVDHGINLMEERLHSKKVLIVLDDVDQLDQLDALAGNSDWFGPGSRIIITTRNEHLLDVLNVDKRYMAVELNHEESLQLFNWHACPTNPLENYVDLANGIVNYAGGLPLALEVLGSYLKGRPMVYWKSAFDQLKQIPDEKIQQKLKISFDALNQEMQDIFLDIACFFVEMDRDYVITILECCYIAPEFGIRVLIDSCLLRINRYNALTMHDLLRDMGREINRQKSPDDLGKRPRLWFHEDVSFVLENNKGTEAIKGVILTGLPMVKKIQWRNKAFAEMHNLRLLQINHVHLSGNFEHLLKELRWLCWHNCPLEYLPSNFHPEKLLVLDMQFSRFKTLQIDSKHFKSLKILNLSNSKCLTKSPIFYALPMLKELLLESCTGLMELHESIGLLDNLVHLNLKDCMNLRYLPSIICKLKSVKHLNLTGCAKLEEFPEHLGHMESLIELFADGTAIKQLPFSIGLLKNLRSLSLKGCNRQFTIKSWFSLISSWIFPRKNPDSISLLPSSVSGLCSLTKLVLCDRNLSEGNFPTNISILSSLQTLDLGKNNFHSLPYGVSQLSKLENLWLEDCTSLQCISDLPPNLLIINVCGCASLEKISDLSKLKNLFVRFCNYPFEVVHILLNRKRGGMEDPHCFKGAQIIPLDMDGLNNLRNLRQPHLGEREFPRKFLHRITGSSSMEAPTTPWICGCNSRFNVGVAFYRDGNEESCSMELDEGNDLYIRHPYVTITDKINCINCTRTPTLFFVIPESSGDYVWRTHIEIEEYIGYKVKGGEQFEVFIMPSFSKVDQYVKDMIVRHNRGNTITFLRLSGLLKPLYDFRRLPVTVCKLPLELSELLELY